MLTNYSASQLQTRDVKSAIRNNREMLEGIRNPQKMANTALLYESLRKHLEEKQLFEGTTTTDIAYFEKYLFPLLRRVFPNLIANDIVSVQPLPARMGAIFFYEYKYDQTKGAVAAGTNMMQNLNTSYASEMIDYEEKVPAALVDGIKTVWNDVTNATDRVPFKWLPMRPYNSIGSYTYRVQLTWTSAAIARTAIDDGAGNLVSGGTPVGTVDYTTGAFTLDFTAIGLTPDNNTPIVALYFYNSEIINAHYQAPSVNPALYGSADQVQRNPSLKLSLTMRPTMARVRPFVAEWSMQTQHDMTSQFGLDAQAEILGSVANEIALEIDREILGDLRANAAHSATWAYSPTFGGANTMTELEAIRSLLTMLSSMSQRIHKTTRRAPANWIVVSSGVAALLEQLSTHSDFMSYNKDFENVQDPSYGLTNSNMGITKAGTIRNKWTVYVDPYMEDEAIIMGLKGQNFADAGYVFAPYVALDMTPVWTDPHTLQSSRGFLSMYSTEMLRPEYYGVITCSGLPSITTVIP